MKKTITYYSDYSLKAWISMILNSEIMLPKYQRSFVWKLKDAMELIDSICNERFVPPVTVASFSGDPNIDPKGIYLIDGQQRLSSILLFYLGYWFVVSDNTNDDENEEDTTTEWSFRKFQKLYRDCNSIEELQDKLKNNHNYKAIGSIPPSKDGVTSTDIISKAQKVSENFKKGDYIDNRTLGFSFIKATGGIESEKKLFAHIFRDINTTGARLGAEESRKALYWLQPDLAKFFMPDFIVAYKINNISVDFAKYLALVGRETYKGYIRNGKNADNINTNIAVGYARKINDYTVEYVTSIVEGDISDEKKYLKNMDDLGKYCNKIFDDKNSKNVIEFDIRIFGLLFWVLFDGKKLKTASIDELKTKISNYNSNSCQENGIINNIRARLKFSINTFKEYLEDA